MSNSTMSPGSQTRDPSSPGRVGKTSCCRPMKRYFMTLSCSCLGYFGYFGLDHGPRLPSIAPVDHLAICADQRSFAPLPDSAARRAVGPDAQFQVLDDRIECGHGYLPSILVERRRSGRPEEQLDADLVVDP